jgi:murein DD-endopeptidase MepM/ murein hydrolase activator NlpD
MAGSFATNYMQHDSINLLTSTQESLDKELIRYDSLNSSLNSSLNQIILNYESQVESISREYESQVENISRELVKIEISSGVDTGDLDVPLQERIRTIGQFYNTKEQEYSEIGNRVEQIEDVIGLDEDNKNNEDRDLATRVELASLTASQERILHDSIPSGFPTDREIITSKFGTRIHPVTKIKSFHKGVDVRAKTGNNVYATADGFVSNSDYSELSGNRIVVLHNFGFETRYSHLREMLVEPGDVVHKGDLIGLSGNTGRSIAPHLHYEIHYLGKATDPYEFLKWEFGTNDIFTQVRGIQWPSLISLINKQITHQTLQLSLLDQ